jgi:hypothetical protein
MALLRFYFKKIKVPKKYRPQIDCLDINASILRLLKLHFIWLFSKTIYFFGVHCKRFSAYVLCGNYAVNRSGFGRI